MEDPSTRTEMDSAQENEGAHHSTVQRKKIPVTKHDSDVSDSSGIGSQESKSMEVEGDDDWQTPSNSSSPLLSKSSAYFEECERVSTHTLFNDDADTLSVGEDSPDFPESVASEAVRSFYSTLAEAIANQGSIDQLASDLYTHSLIENTVLSQVQTLGLPNERKTSVILNAVLSKIRIPDANVRSFDIFVQILDKYPCCREIKVMITAKYAELKQRQCETGGQQTQEEHSGFGPIAAHSPFLPHSMPNFRQPSPCQLLEMDQLSGSHQTQKKYKTQLCRHSVSSGEDSDVNDMSEEDIRQELRRLKQFTKCMKRFVDRKQHTQCIAEEILRRTEAEVEERQKELEHCSQQLETCTKEKEVLIGQLQLARRQILQLNKEVLFLKRPTACNATCEHKAECEKLTNRITRLEEDKLEYMATIENLTQQRDLLLRAP